MRLLQHADGRLFLSTTVLLFKIRTYLMKPQPGTAQHGIWRQVRNENWVELTVAERKMKYTADQVLLCSVSGVQRLLIVLQNMSKLPISRMINH